MNLNLYSIEFCVNSDQRFLNSCDFIAPLAHEAPQAPAGYVYAESAREAARAYWECHDFRPNLRIKLIKTEGNVIGTYRAVPHTTFEPELVVE